MYYSNVNQVKSSSKTTRVTTRKKQHFLASFVLCLLVVSGFGLTINSEHKLSTYLKRITNRWVPKEEDIGKIKFVNFSFVENEAQNGVFIVSSPFKNYYANNITKTSLEVFGLGDPIVISPIDGVLQKVELKNNKYDICLCNNDVKVFIKDVDFVCANEGDNLTKGQQLAVSSASRIIFELQFKSESVELPAAGANDTFFE
ncbi:MAG: hypothetical protein IJ542_02370 [Clostridia bacterium]|nr:hypothetical protein [Clostridia bacterium]